MYGVQAWRFVYFIQSGESGPIKIGISEDPELRMSRFQIAHGETLRLLACMHGTRSTEKSLHYRFRRLRMRGEWFRPEKELLDYIVLVKSKTAPNATSAARESGKGEVWRRDSFAKSRQEPLDDSSPQAPSRERSASIAEPSKDGVNSAKSAQSAPRVDTSESPGSSCEGTSPKSEPLSRSSRSSRSAEKASEQKSTRYVTVARFCTELDLNEFTVRRWCREGKHIHGAIQLDKNLGWKIPFSELERYRKFYDGFADTSREATG